VVARGGRRGLALHRAAGAKWREPVRQLFEDFAARTPGSLVEEKTASIAWHYRMADPEFGASQANELRLHLASILSNEPVEILPVVKAIEVRPHGLDKGRVVETVVAAAPAGSILAALGDDRTDEDMFAALPAGALAGKTIVFDVKVLAVEPPKASPPKPTN